MHPERSMVVTCPIAITYMLSRQQIKMTSLKGTGIYHAGIPEATIRIIKAEAGRSGSGVARFA